MDCTEAYENSAISALKFIDHGFVIPVRLFTCSDDTLERFRSRSITTSDTTDTRIRKMPYDETQCAGRYVGIRVREEQQFASCDTSQTIESANLSAAVLDANETQARIRDLPENLIGAII
jgi:hypothetical protein